MVKPNQPKGIKPKADASEIPEAEIVSKPGMNLGELSGMKLVIVNTVITVIICTLFLGGNYFIVNGIVGAKLEHFKPTAAEGGEESGEEGEDGEEKHEKGIILDLGEFILNLTDPGAKRYLKVNVALELTKAKSDPGDEHGGKSGGHGEKAEDPAAAIEKSLSQYRPAIRDAVISVLSSKTAEELSSQAGKELAKEQIKESINPIFSGEREVLRVSFGTFIIQ